VWKVHALVAGGKIFMKRTSLGMHLAISSLWMVSFIGLFFGAVAWHLVSVQVHQQAQREAAQQSDELVGLLTTIDQLSRAQVESAMRILETQGQLKGQPSLGGTATLNGKSVPDLHLGSESQVQNYTVVDRVKELAGGTATLFAWDGTNFIRVTTNVIKPDGSRAIGTLLDPKGKAYAALTVGRSFEGVVDILGSPYTTSYVPMMDQNGKLVGAWYTGFRLDSFTTLGKSIREINILDHGFAALLKPTGVAIFHGQQISDDALSAILQNPKGWTVLETIYPPWGYKVLTAYPKSDVTTSELKILGLLCAGILILSGLILGLQLFLLERQVLRPVKYLTERLEHADLNTLLETDHNDEIGTLSQGFNEFVLRLRQAMFQLRDGSAATTSKSGEIRTIAHSSVAQITEQHQCAVNAAQGATQLSASIASTSNYTNQASDHVRNAANAARQGNQQVSSAVALMQGLSEDTQQSATRIASLTERTKQIGTIVGVIDEIAAGTNLLALNASIEAARAGEHGRGFAVVAGEVRRLAERTAQATRQVADLVSGIEEETGHASRVILDACNHAAQGAEAVSGLNKTFEHISSLVIEVDGRMAQIAQAAQADSNTANEVSATMHRMAESSQQSAAGAGIVMTTAGELMSTAQTLEGLVQQFKLHDLAEDHR
jgi:methyl-accepting chemotaxis protein